jgi:tRNA pseudouridine38-40 synthase
MLMCARTWQGLFAAGCIGEGNFGFLQKIQWARAARTDKGVHALGNCVSARLLLEDDVDPVSLFFPHEVELCHMFLVTSWRRVCD